MADSVSSCKEEFGSACRGLPTDDKRAGKLYCVLHSPRGNKDLAAFDGAIEKKLEDNDFDFRGVYFPSIPGNIEEPIGFYNVTFEGEANFNSATFKGMANFYNATFESRARFYMATFEEEAYFAYATFKEIALFYNATFQEGANFWSLQTSPTQTRLIFRAAVIDKAERFSFHSTYLRPSWFLDVDAQKFDFSDVEWFRLPNGKKLTLEKEIKFLDGLRRTPSYERLSPRSNLRRLQRACRNLMNNAEENRDYPTANEFHYWSMELLRKESWWRRLGLIGTLYWLLSGYGERPRRAFLVLVEMWILFAILYMVWGPKDLQVDLLQVAVQALSGADIRQGIEHTWKALVYSLAAIARLNPEPKPSAPGVFQLLVTAEGLLGPLQIALLALAVRRKVMR